MLGDDVAQLIQGEARQLFPEEFLSAFGVDADFAGCVDGLIELDLERMHPRKRQRYLHTPTQEQAA